MKLSANFELSELVKSQVAERHGLPNNPNPDQIDNLKELCINILQPIRSSFDKPLIISSGYRSPEVSLKIGSSFKSQHCEGKAADFEIPGVSNEDLALWIKNNLQFDQLILEFHTKSDPNSGWIHCSWNGADNRNQTLIAYRDPEDGKVKYKPW
ncbi:D-Ala-D-Ala carboxypeptidase family metallohydrolase [Limnobacter sp.]|uniref:D-Ala-D-Ala carboxypeptidase family metallohydrolase n=1 Tax=Limnobacter sp. TaxID=2003368 RepID=UPI00311E42CA